MCFSVICAGCSVWGDNLNLMRPPKAAGDKAEIQRILDKTTNGEYTLKYPKNGEYRSAIIMKDLNNDGSLEAVALYSGKNDPTSGINVLIMAEKEDGWIVIGNFSNKSTEINKVSFADINSDGMIEIIVGWGGYSISASQISIYYWNDNNINEIINEHSFSNYSVGDYNGDNVDEILLISIATANSPAIAQMVSLKPETNTLYTVAEARLDPDVNKIVQIKNCKIGARQSAAVIDGKTSLGIYNTQIIYFDTEKNVLKNSLYMKQVEENVTSRPIPVFSADFSNNNEVQIPTCHLMPHGEHEDILSVAYLTTWNIYSAHTDSLDPVSRTVLNLTYNYSFTLSDKWENDEFITARYSEDESVLTFYKWDDVYTSVRQREKLMIIKVFSIDEWVTPDLAEGYTLFERTAEYVYAYSIPGNSYLNAGDETEMAASFKFFVQPIIY